MVSAAGFKPAAFGFVDRRSIQTELCGGAPRFERAAFGARMTDVDVRSSDLARRLQHGR